MAQIIPVAFYPNKPQGAFLGAIKEAKSGINTELLIKPVKAVPNTPARVIAVGESPYWICRHVLIRPGDRESLREALEWALELKDSSNNVTVLHQLREVLGPEVEELTDGEQV